MAEKVIMAIGGHVGDAELSSGGTLATLALKGWKVVTLALTGGERGNPPHMTVADYRVQKEAEAHAFAEKLNGEAVILDYVEGELPDNEEVRLQVAAAIRKYKPKVLLTHWKNSMHKDHERTHKIVKDAQFYAGLASFEMEQPAHYASGPYYAENWEDSVGFVPYTYMEVSEEGFELWKEAIQLHWFTVNSKSFKYAEYYQSLMKTNGYLARKQYAEAFAVDELAKKHIISEF